MANSYTSIKRVSMVREGSIKSRTALTSSVKAKEFFRKYWEENSPGDQESIVVVCLDTKLKPMCVVVITLGTLDASLFHPRECFKPAIIEGACAIMLSHNHPSGEVTPSKEDHDVTRKAEEAGAVLGIQLLAHIIYGNATGDTYSIKAGE